MTRNQSPAAAAERMVRTARSAAAVAAGAEMLDPDSPRLREAVLARYSELASDPYRSDPGGEVRGALLRALSPEPADVPLLVAASRVKERMPPRRDEVAGGVRAAALAALLRVDPDLAAFHAVRLLFDPDTSEMSGEPAATAVRLLGAAGALHGPHAYALRGAGIPDVVAEALRALVAAPPSAVDDAVAAHATSKSEVVLLGLFDLMLAAPGRERFAETVRRFLRETNLPDAHRYACAAIVASRDPVLIEELRGHASLSSGAKREAAEEALSLI